MYHYHDAKAISAEQREKLYNEIWTEPVSKVAPRYGISDTLLRRRCVECWDIPVPENGYWAKKRAGKPVRQPELHEWPSEEARKYVYGYSVSYKDFSTIPTAALYSNEPLFLFSEKTKMRLNSLASRTDLCEIPKRLSWPYTEKYRTWIDESKDAVWTKRAVDFLVSLDQQIIDLEGYTDAEVTMGGTLLKGYIFVCDQHFSFRISQTANQKQMKMEIQWDYWNWNFDAEKPNEFIFSDSPNRLLESQLGNLIYCIFVAAGKHLQKQEIKERENQRKEKEAAFQRKIAPMVAEENEKVSQALADAENYEKACSIRNYAEAYYNKNGAKFNECPELKSYYDWLHARADWIDPLIENDYEALLARLRSCPYNGVN